MATGARADRISVLFGIVAISAFDRLTIAPLLGQISTGLHTSPATTTLAATAHFLCYGLTQLGHGWLSDRIGRRRALRIALATMTIANAISAVAPSVGVLIVGRAVAGAASGGLVPGALVMLADQSRGVQTARRQAALFSALGIGTALSALAGLGGQAEGWRVVFAVTAMGCAVLAVPIGSHRQAPRVRSGQPRVLTVTRRPPVRFLALVAIPEGAAVFGFILFFPPALRHLGWSTPLAALATAAVGAGMLLGSVVVRPLTGNLSDTTLLGGGAALLAAGYTLATVTDGTTTLAAAALVGVAQSALHATLQRWATLAAPDARGISTSLFATGTFAGAGVAALLGTALPNRFATLFLISALCAAIAGLAATRRAKSNPMTELG